MLEIILCSLFTVVPDYLYRRYGQGKRLGKEITIFSVWYELRYGITGCLMLAVLLITVIFYFHPSTSLATPLFRSVSVLPETNGRVSEIYVSLSEDVEKGQRIFKLDSTSQEADLEVAKRRIAEIEASLLVAQTDIAAADAQIQQAKSALEQATDELRTKQDLMARNANVVAAREIERLETTAEGRRGQVAAAEAAKLAAETRVKVQLPAQRATAIATLQQAQVDLDKRIVYAGVAGRVEQFTLRVGDVVNPMMRPAGILIPAGAGRSHIIAGFGQIEAQVMKPGMIAEALCVSKPLTIIPMVVVQTQSVIAGGQVRTGEQLIDLQQAAKPGTISVFLQPLYENGLDGVPPGSNCIVNAYTSNHDRIVDPKTGLMTKIALHGVDAVGVVHAMIIRVQALLLPIKLLVLGGH
jgi:multidrug resistance efflux pump